MCDNTPPGRSVGSPYIDSYVSGEIYQCHVVGYDIVGHDALIHEKFSGDSSDCSGSWATTYIPNTAGSRYPSCELRPSNNDLYIAYYEDNGDGTSDYKLVIYNGSTYSIADFADGPDPVDDLIPRPVVGFDSNSNLYIAYINEDYNVMVRKRTSGGLWQTPQRIDNQNNRRHNWLHLSIDPRSNKPHVVYDEEYIVDSPPWNIFWSRFE